VFEARGGLALQYGAIKAGAELENYGID